MSPRVDRAGPFDTAEEAARAPEIIRERSRAWAEEDARERLRGGIPASTDARRTTTTSLAARPTGTGGDSMDKQRDFVLRTIEERGVKFVRLWFTDVIGTLKSVAIAPAEVEGAFSEGLGFDGSAIEGLTRSLRVRPARPPRPDDVPDPAVARRDRPDRAHVLRHHDPRRPARRRRSPPRAEARARQGRRRAASRSTRTPRSSSTC